LASVSKTKSKIYEILPDEKAAEDDYFRVIDESGEDYLYPAKYFCAVDVPQVVQDTVSGSPPKLRLPSWGHRPV